MSTIKNETWRLRGVDLELACVLDTPAFLRRMLALVDERG